MPDLGDASLEISARGAKDPPTELLIRTSCRDFLDTIPLWGPENLNGDSYGKGRAYKIGSLDTDTCRSRGGHCSEPWELRSARICLGALHLSRSIRAPLVAIKPKEPENVFFKASQANERYHDA
jgi:hypothetical protein